MSNFVQQNATICDFKTTDSWVILSSIEQSIKRKIEAVGTPLKDWDIQINYGIKTGFNDAFIISTEKRNEILDNCSSDEERQRTAELIRPILRGRDIKRYGYNWADLHLIATFPSRHYNIDDYPAVKAYLLSFGRERLEQTGKKYMIDGEEVKARKKTNNKWFETQDSISYWEDFDKPMIAWLELSDEPKFTLVDNVIPLNTVFFMTGNYIVHLLGLLNSKLITWYFRNCIGTTSGVGTNRWLKYTIERIPMLSYSKEIESITKQLMNSSHNALEDSSRLESILLTEICNGYGLTSEERKYIEFGGFL